MGWEAGLRPVGTQWEEERAQKLWGFCMAGEVKHRRVSGWGRPGAEASHALLNDLRSHLTTALLLREQGVEVVKQVPLWSSVKDYLYSPCNIIINVEIMHLPASVLINVYFMRLKLGDFAVTY